MNSCFNLMRRLSPNDIAKNVAGLANIITDENVKFDFIQKIDQPLGKLLIDIRVIYIMTDLYPEKKGISHKIIEVEILTLDYYNRN